MSRYAVIAERERILAAAARVPTANRRVERRARFIQAERLSLPEITALSPGFDPGPDYDPKPLQERLHG